MEGSSQPEKPINPAKYTKRELANKLAKSIRDTNQQILDDPTNYQVNNPKVPEYVKEERLTEREQQRTRRGALAAIGVAAASIGSRLAWPRIKQEVRERERFWSKTNQNPDKDRVIPPGTLANKDSKQSS